VSEPFIGQIKMFGGNFAPRGYALCDGQLLPIAQSTALFSILGTTYGGDGESTFGLPDLRGRVPLHAGTGPGLTPRNLGQSGGTETETVTVNTMPSHSHTVKGVDTIATTQAPSSNAALANTAVGGRAGGGATPYGLDDDDGENDTVVMAGASVGNSGASAAHNNIQPRQAINYIIALDGVFPSEG
jgi:microcystin-dependent protein